MGKAILIVGVILVVVGLVLMYAPGAFSWFGKLPGDIHIQNGNTRIFIPITSMLILSILLSLIANFIFKQ